MAAEVPTPTNNSKGTSRDGVLRRRGRVRTLREIHRDNLFSIRKRDREGKREKERVGWVRVEKEILPRFVVSGRAPSLPRFESFFGAASSHLPTLPESRPGLKNNTSYRKGRRPTEPVGPLRTWSRLYGPKKEPAVLSTRAGGKTREEVEERLGTGTPGRESGASLPVGFGPGLPLRTGGRTVESVLPP